MMLAVPEINSFSTIGNSDAIFSILIPSWNNLPYLKLCVASIEKNSSFKHQIIIHVNEGLDSTLAWVQEKGFAYTYSKENVAIGHTGINILAGKKAPAFAFSTNLSPEQTVKFQNEVMHQFYSMVDNIFIATTKW
jgi:hypothetical protein